MFDSAWSPLSWAHSEFIALSSRSSFHDHLQILQLLHVAISEGELLPCLSVLGSLQRLAIWDHQLPDNHVITNTLLSRRTRTPDSPVLLPHLHALTCISRLRFDDSVYLNFLISRVPLDGGTFENELRWIPGYRRKLDGSVIARIQQLRIRKQPIFSLTGPEDQ